MNEMTDVLRAHGVAGMSGGTHIACRCDRRWVLHDEHRTHLAAALSAAGFGDVREAGAAALEEAAAIVASEENDQWRRAKEHSPGAQIVAQRMQVVGKVIRTRAAAMRGEG